MDTSAALGCRGVPPHGRRQLAANSAAANGDQPAAVPAGRVFASPLVRKLAGEKGIDLAAIEGTGPNGRITRRDLEHHLAAPAPALPAQAAAPGTVLPAAPLPPGARLISHTPMRRAIARRLTESKASIPHFYLAAECAVDELLALRARVNETAPVKVSVNDFVIMAAAAAFTDVPEANVTWADEGLVVHENVDISIAVATEGGLVTPVLRDAARKKLTQVARESADLARRARDRRLAQHELEGGAFAISNLGMYGTLEFSAIINPPQSAILAVGAARQQPVVVDGAVTAANGHPRHPVGRPPRHRRGAGGPLAGRLHRPHGQSARRDRLTLPRSGRRPARLPRANAAYPKTRRRKPAAARAACATYGSRSYKSMCWRASSQTISLSPGARSCSSRARSGEQ